MKNNEGQPDRTDLDVPNETDNADQFTNLNLIGNIRESIKLKSMSNTPTNFMNISAIASHHEDEKLIELDQADNRSRTPRNIRVLQSKDKIEQLREECKRVNQIVKNSVNNVSKIIERNAGKIKRSITLVGNPNSCANPNRLIQQIPEQANDDEIYVNTTFTEEKTKVVDLSSKKTKKVLSKESQSPATTKKTYSRTNDKIEKASKSKADDSSVEKANHSKPSPHRLRLERNAKTNASTMQPNKEVPITSIANRVPSHTIVKPTLDMDQSFMMPRYALDSLLSLYKGYKIRRILKSSTISYLVSEISEMKKIISNNTNSKDEANLKERVRRHMKEFVVRFEQMLNDPYWFKQKLIRGVLKKKISYALLSEDLNKIVIDKSDDKNERAEDKVTWHTLEEKKRIRLYKKGSNTSGDFYKDQKIQDKSRSPKNKKDNEEAKFKDKKEEKKRNDTKKEDKKEKKKEEKSKEEVKEAKKEEKKKRDENRVVNEKPSEVKKSQLNKQDSLKKLSTSGFVESDIHPQHTFDNSELSEDPKIEELVQKLYSFFNDIKKNNGYQGTLATKKRQMDKTFEVLI